MAVPPPSKINHSLRGAMSEIAMDKTALRRAIRARRAAFVAGMDAAALARHTQALAARLAPAFAHAASLGGYAASGAEISVLPALERAAALGLETALPHVLHRAAPMLFLPWQPGQRLDQGWAGLSQPEPAAAMVPALILAPLLGFDRRRHRIGQGAGFYDRWFALHPQALRIGVAWSVQEEDAIPVDAWDVPLHAIVTENEWIGPPL